MQSRKYSALVVDDNRDVAESFAKVLLVLGCDATFLTDSRHALDEALRLEPDIAFLDLGMPYVTGYELARQLRERFPAERMKLVAVTAYGEPEHRAASRKVGFDAHVQKPVDPAMVQSILKTLFP